VRKCEFLVDEESDQKNLNDLSFSRHTAGDGGSAANLTKFDGPL